MSIFGGNSYGHGFGASSSKQIIRVHEAGIVLRRILEFTRHSIDDVINDSVARNRVRLYFKVNRLVDRHLKEFELEKRAEEEASGWMGRP